ncbi:prepilin peptidase [Sphingomicrobium nitratireducens]|uniref:prepilin peptidase n=1 Tax=Sphingomicrobium nitratireducens TaxID=2964666 RepID=UPI002240471E|nr:prepilin peptidase [Sphingomicrobium nitratireducens]
MNLIAMVPDWLAAIFAALLLAAAVEDVWRMKISNWTVLALLVAAVAAIFVVGFEVDAWKNLAILVVGLTLGTFMFSAGWMGGGDVKLTVAALVWFSVIGALQTLAAIALAGAVLVIVTMVTRGVGLGEKKRGRMVSYGVAVAAGSLLMAAFERGLV